MNLLDTNIQNRKEIRWHSFSASTASASNASSVSKDDTVRAYAYTAPLKLNEKTVSMSAHFRPVEDDNWGNLTDTGIEIVNELLSLSGILAVYAGTFEMHISRTDDAHWDEIHDHILAVINRRLFAGAALISRLPYHRRDQPTIRWCDEAYQDHVRSYHLSTSLKLDKTDRFQETIFGSRHGSGAGQKQVTADSHPRLTEVSRHIVNLILSWRGVICVSVSPSALSVQLAPVFYWEDYHPAILDLLNETLCGGDAWIEAGNR